MSLYRKPNSPFWQYDFVLHGRRFFGSTKTTRRRDAELIVARIRHDALLPRRERPPITLDDAAGLYAAHAETLPSWPTIEYITAALVEGLGKAKPLAEISQSDLANYFARRRAGKGGKIRANSSINREVENARAIWRRAEKARYDVGEMPDWGAFRLKTPKQKLNLLAVGETETTLLSGTRGDIRDAIDFLLKSGWRRNEVLGLKWTDVDLGRRMAWTKIKGGDWIERPLTTAMVIIIARQPRGLDTVFSYVCDHSTTRTTKAGEKLILRKGERYPITKYVLRQAWQAARTSADVETLRLHDLRHTRATRMLEASKDLAATGKALGHQSLKTTLRYAHVLADQTRNALEAGDAAEAAATHTKPQPETPASNDERKSA